MSTGSEEGRDSFDSGKNGVSMPSPMTKAESNQMPKPDIVKRMTSNQNETVETKPDFDGHSVKRAALNREGSLASNRLKEKYMPGYFDSKKEVEMLSSNLRQSSLSGMTTVSETKDCVGTATVKPALVTMEDRMTTLDMSALDLVVRPMSLGTASRSTTIEALDLGFDDPFAKMGGSQMDWFSDNAAGGTKQQDNDDDEDDAAEMPGRPAALSLQQRLTTSDLIDIVNEPIVDV